MPSIDLLDNPKFIDDLTNLQLSERAVADKWGCANSTVHKYRKKAVKKDGLARKDKLAELRAADSKAPDFTRDVTALGDIAITKKADRIIPLSEWLDDLRCDGLDPDDYDTSHGHSVWTVHTRDGETKTLYSNRFSAVKKRQKDTENGMVSPEDALESVRETIASFHYVHSVTPAEPESFVVVPTDLQVGKVDWNGGTLETAEQALRSFSRAAELVKERRPQEVCIVDSGDVIENYMNTASQIATNDRDLPHQIVAAMQIMLEGIRMLAPLAPSVRYAAVTSNHGAHRIGIKQQGGDAHADYGIAIAKLLASALTLNPDYSHVTVQTPDPYMESLYFQSSGTDIGVVHGHQAGNADKLGDWWKGQSHGNMPVSKARILLAGHFHSLRVQQSGDSRWLFVGPSSDRGSSWFTNLKGEQSESGMLSFFTADNRWTDLAIL